MNKQNKVTEYWNNTSDDYFKNHWAELAEIENDPEFAFPPKVRRLINACFSDLNGKTICVPSSGDNFAAFAFCMLGARVTSCDISKRQLENAAKTAKSKNWDIEFICADSMKLDGVQEDYYDMVYTSNGAHVWISNLKMLYGSFRRILKPGGRYVFFETHPMIRPFDDKGSEIIIEKPYDETGPFGEVPTYSWRMCDFINALARSGFVIQAMEEFSSTQDDHISYDYKYKTKADRENDNGRLYDWKQNPWAALPDCFAISSVKE